MTRKLIALLGTLAVAACAGGEAQDVAERTYVYAVGSSTVYPFTKAVADKFQASHPDLPPPVVQHTGTGEGLSYFCGGSGGKFPDIADASRQMRPDEAARCTANGVNDIVELRIGTDGISFVDSPATPKLSLTRKQVYEALAAMPYGEPNTTKKWSDVSPSLPDFPILVYGPPPKDGTRDMLEELVMKPACRADARVKKLDAAGKPVNQICTQIRADKAYRNTGEDDDQTMLSMIVNPGAVGIVGYHYLQQNSDKLKAIPIDGVVPTTETIASGGYAGSRPLYIYVKRGQSRTIAGLRDFIASYTSALGPKGYLAAIGLIPASEESRLKAVQVASTLQPGQKATKRS